MIKPQRGYQEKMLKSKADIVIGGGAAGGGKTFSLLLDPLYHVHNGKFGGVIFRRTSPQIRAEGGLWDTSVNIYSLLGATPRQSILEWEFKSGAKIKFSHLEYEKNKLDWQGSQIAFLGFDELTHFSESMFFYLLSRNRSASGIKPYVRCTCNPDPDSWVSNLITWWINQETGYPIPERDGVLRYFVKDSNTYIWGDSENEVYEKSKHIIQPAIDRSRADGFELKLSDFIKSITFISGSVYQNIELLKVNPAYLSNLMSLPENEKACLLEGNWKVRLNDSDLYDYFKFKDIFTNSYVSDGKRFITADIALRGSDKLVIYVWSGFKIIDCEVMDKSDGKQVVDKIKELANKHRVQESNIVYDNDGVGGFIDGFIAGAKAFNNGSRAMNEENYRNLKTQCFYKSADRVNNGEIYIIPEIADKIIGGKTLKQQLLRERRAIKRDKINDDGKLCINQKSAQKIILNGQSPDHLDAFAMREFFELIAIKLFFKENIDYQIVNEMPDNLKKIGYGLCIGNEIKPTTINEYFKIGSQIYVNEIYCSNKQSISKLIQFIMEYENFNISDLIITENKKDLIKDLRIRGLNCFGSKNKNVISGISHAKEFELFITNESLNLISEFKKYGIDEKSKTGSPANEYQFSSVPNLIYFLSQNKYFF